MNFFYSYLIQSSASIVVLYLVYWLFLKRETFFAVNRFYLAGSILFSLLFPLLHFNIRLVETGSVYTYLLNTVIITPDRVAATVSPYLPVMKIIVVIYLTGASLFTFRFLFQLYQVASLINKYGTSRRMGFRMVFTDRNYQPFSFFGFVFLPESLKEAKALPQILEHETVHVRQIHSIDLMLLEVLTIIHWFNPVIWLYRRSIKSIHEYLADEGVLTRGFDPFNYQELLLNHSLGIQVNDLTNNFNHSLLKNRIIMMTKKRSGTFSGWKAFVAIPVLIALVMIFSTSVNSGSTKELLQSGRYVSHSGKPVSVVHPLDLIPGEDTLAGTVNKEPVYEVVKTMPEFNGGFDALVRYLVTNIKYPEEARNKKITGTVFVSFVVMKNGKVVNASVLKGVDPLLDAEALRVVTAMPDWKPGLDEEGNAVNVRFHLPIKFTLNEDNIKQGEK